MPRPTALPTASPAVPTAARARATREAPVLAAVLKLLAWRGVPAWRCNSGMLRNPAGRPVRFGAPGMSDVHGVLPWPAPSTNRPCGRLIAIEAKRPNGVPTAAQLAYLRAVRDAGGVALVIDDPAALARALDLLQADPTRVLDLDGRPAEEHEHAD